MTNANIDGSTSVSLSEINRTLAEVVAATEEKKSVARKLAQARETLNSERSRLAALQSALDREQRDVTRLEGLSLSNLFHTVLGDKHAVMDKEQQEFLTAKLRRDEALASVESLEQDVQALESRLARAGHPEDDLRRLTEAKERLVLAEGGPQAEALLSLAEERGRLMAERKEVSEALAAGRQVERVLEEVLRSLERAQGWGVWDMMGGGLLATAAKHSNLDKAREQVHQAQSLIQRFRRELDDIGRVTEGLSIGGFERFADYFFDGLFIDWMVQSKINTGINRTREQLSRVTTLVRTLDETSKSLEARIRGLDARRETLLTK